MEIVNSFFVNSKTKTKIDDDNEDENSKYGSLQLFANHMDNAGNYGYMMFSEKEVHKIAILDIRILNCDRNEENILLKKVLRRNHNNINNNNNKNDKSNIEFQLIPIDHGLAFPDQISICNCEIVWMEWPQVQHPFSLEEIEFIKNINPKEDVKFLHKHLKMREICLRNFRIAEILLKKCAENGLTLYDIGKKFK